MKSILLAVRPFYVHKILSREKGIELRRSIPTFGQPHIAPQHLAPFKCYIYCTYGQGLIEYGDEILPNMLLEENVTRGSCYGNCCNGKVVAEFICNTAEGFTTAFRTDVLERIAKGSCLSIEQMEKYENNPKSNKGLFALHISDLKVYDRPRPLGDFRIPCREYKRADPRCGSCDYYKTMGEYPAECACDGAKPVVRPPQSWCYVEDLT